MKAIFALTLSTILSVTSASSMSMGSCPKYESNMAPERFNHTKFGGLWYEYMYNNDYRQKNQYECASWNLLAHKDSSHYDLLANSRNNTSDITVYNRYHLWCGAEGTQEAQTCEFKTQEPASIVHKMTIQKPREFQIIATDMFSYAVASACYEYKLAHSIDYVVLTREKQPSMWARG